MPDTRVLLVRHAEAVCNVEGTFVGHETCKGLTPRGHRQCATVADRVALLCAMDGDVVLVSSQMKRAVQTADAIAVRMDRTERLPPSCGLCERHPGALAGATRPRVRELDERGELPPDTESMPAFLLRVRRELRRVVATCAGRTVVVVTHAGVITASFWVFGGVSSRLPFRVQPDNGSLTEWSTDPGRSDVWWLRRYNDVSAPP